MTPDQATHHTQKLADAMMRAGIDSGHLKNLHIQMAALAQIIHFYIVAAPDHALRDPLTYFDEWAALTRESIVEDLRPKKGEKLQ